ncbi:hypothetical protein L7F22_060111 [Adiantum nelumboides]|nr:hypothetical protein [Adiantum nelumboides]
MGRSKRIEWQYVEKIKALRKGQWTCKCNFCGHVWGDGPHRIRSHLLSLLGQGVGPCDSVTEDVKDIVRRLHADASSDGKDSREAIDALVDDLGGSASQSQGDASLSTHGEGSTHASGSSKSNVNSSKKRKVAQGAGGLPAACGLQARKQADQALRRFFYAEDVPEWKVRSPYFLDMIKAIGNVGPSYVPPSYHALRTTELNDEVQCLKKEIMGSKFCREKGSHLWILGVQKKPWLACEAKGEQSAADFNGSFVDKPINNEGDLTERILSTEQSYQEDDAWKFSEASTSNREDSPNLLSQSKHFGKKCFKNRFLLLAKLGTTIRRKLESFFKSEIRQRALVTVLMLIAVRAGHFIPLPGYDRRFMPGDYLSYPSGAGEGVADLGSEMRLSLFQLGIGPYMGASIIMQVLCYIVPQLIRLRKEGSEGVKRIKQYTERLAFALAVVQALIISMQSISYSVYAAENRLKYFVTSVSLMSLGASLINWICNQITESGFGQGPSLFICVNILTGYADSLYKVISGLICEFLDHCLV